MPTLSFVTLPLTATVVYFLWWHTRWSVLPRDFFFPSLISYGSNSVESVLIMSQIHLFLYTSAASDLLGPYCFLDGLLFLTSLLVPSFKPFSTVPWGRLCLPSCLSPFRALPWDKVQVNCEEHRALGGLAHWLFLQLHLLLPPLLPLLQPQREILAVQETDLVLYFCVLELTTHPPCLEAPAPSSSPPPRARNTFCEIKQKVSPHPISLLQHPHPFSSWFCSMAELYVFHCFLLQTQYHLIFYFPPQWAPTLDFLILSFILSVTWLKQRYHLGSHFFTLTYPVYQLFFCQFFLWSGS